MDSESLKNYIFHLFRGYCSGSESIYQAVWANNGDFDEVLVSPTMVNDHMPDNVLEALEKVGGLCFL